MTPKKQQEVRDQILYETNRTSEPVGFPVLPLIPSARYTSKEFFDLEMEKFWTRVWLPVAREEELPKPGDFIVWRKIGKPILVIRGKDNIVRAFYNTCRHRGAAVTPEDSGSVPRLICQFHAWCYDLDGRLLTVPDLHDFPGGVDKKSMGLKPLRCEIADGSIFINCDLDARPLHEHMAPYSAEIACMEPQKLRLVHKHKWIVDANWKAALDAFQETYHLRIVHRNSFAKAYDQKTAAMGLIENGHSRMVIGYLPGALEVIMAKRDEDTPDIPGTSELNRNHSITYTVFPNGQSTIRAAMIFENRFWPISPNKTEVEFVAIAPDWGDGPLPEYWAKAAPLNISFLDEDLENLNSIQESLESGALEGMTINYQERRIYWTQQMIDAVIGPENIPQEMRVPPILKEFVEPFAESDEVLA